MRNALLDVFPYKGTWNLKIIQGDVVLDKFTKTIFLLLTLFQVTYGHADSFDQPCYTYNNLECCWIDDITVEGRFSAFFPLDSRVRDIYHDVLPCFELQATTTLYGCWQEWVNVGYIFDNGRSIGESDKTQLNLLPISFGVNYLFSSCDCMNWYIGAGALYSFLRTEDHSPFVHEHVRKNAWGGVAKIGFYYQYTDCVYFEGFFDYIYQKFSFSNSEPEDDVPYVERNDVDLSALKLGVGLGFRF